MIFKNENVGIIIIDLKEKQFSDLITANLTRDDNKIEFINTGSESIFNCNILPENSNELFIQNLRTDKYIGYKGKIDKDAVVTIVLGYGGEINHEKDKKHPDWPYITMHTIDKCYKLIDVIPCNYDSLIKTRNEYKEVEITINKVFATLSLGGTRVDLIGDTDKGLIILTTGRSLVDPSYLEGMTKYVAGMKYNVKLQGTAELEHIILNNQSKTYPAIITTSWMVSNK